MWPIFVSMMYEDQYHLANLARGNYKFTNYKVLMLYIVRGYHHLMNFGVKNCVFRIEFYD
jgi:hypothetical protein